MFVDCVEIACFAGNGGDGCCSFRREAHVPRGGPDGGDGGAGGSVIIRADYNLGSLANLVGHHFFRADHGKAGEGSMCTGRSGDDIVILVPPGTLVKDKVHGHVLKDLADGDQIVIAQGGKGGRGNRSYASSTNRTPREFDRGEEGESRAVILELKLIADVGVIGKPNAGKSTLLSRMSRATPEIANYPFTTKYPNLGVVKVGYDHQFVMADIPGLIEGAHAGVGLGHEFLKHVQRTKLFVHLVEPDPDDQTNPIDNYHQIRKELELYDSELTQRPEIICISKAELPDSEAAALLLEESIGQPVMRISAATGQGLPELVKRIVAHLQGKVGEDW
ncbi:MAG: GTPase ObgE [Planctomycetota bacterium]|nr:MAG: GTPase ObgE [Planctomycetota bacterium]